MQPRVYIDAAGRKGGKVFRTLSEKSTCANAQTQKKNIHELRCPFHSVGVEVGSEGFSFFCPPTGCLQDAVETECRTPVESSIDVVRSAVWRLECSLKINHSKRWKNGLTVLCIGVHFRGTQRCRFHLEHDFSNLSCR